MRLKVTSGYWSEMRQAAEIKREMRQTNSSVTVISHDRRGESAGLEPFCGLEIAEAASDCGVSLGANAFFVRSSLSRKLAGKSVITERRSRCRRASLPLSTLCLAEARLERSALHVLSDVSVAAIDDDAPRFQANKHQHRYPIASRPRDGVTSRMPTQQRASRSLEAHTLKNVAARPSVACGPETHSCGAAVGYQN